MLLLCLAWFLAGESHSLLIGEGASRRVDTVIRKIVAADPEVDTVVARLRRAIQEAVPEATAIYLSARDRSPRR